MQLIMVPSLDEGPCEPCAFVLHCVPVTHRPRLVLDLPASVATADFATSS